MSGSQLRSISFVDFWSISILSWDVGLIVLWLQCGWSREWGWSCGGCWFKFQQSSRISFMFSYWNDVFLDYCIFFLVLFIPRHPVWILISFILAPAASDWRSALWRCRRDGTWYQKRSPLTSGLVHLRITFSLCVYCYFISTNSCIWNQPLWASVVIWWMADPFLLSS